MEKKSVKIDGRVISYLEEGKGQAVVLLPGLASDCEDWQEIVAKLRSHFRVYAFSLPFYGTYNNHGQRYTYNTFPSLLEKLVKTFKIQKPVLVGHSLGAVICVKYIAQHPNSVARLVCVSAPFTDHSQPIPPLWRFGVDFALKSKRTQEIIDWLETNQELVSLVMSVAFPQRNLARLTKAGTEMLSTMPAKSMALCYKDTFDLSFRTDLEKVHLPTLFVYGTQDTALAAINGTALYNLIPEAKVVTLPTSHFIPVDEPEKLSELILKFLKEN